MPKKEKPFPVYRKRKLSARVVGVIEHARRVLGTDPALESKPAPTVLQIETAKWIFQHGDEIQGQVDTEHLMQEARNILRDALRYVPRADNHIIVGTPAVTRAGPF